MNTLPRPKIYENANARARAYQQRKRIERAAAKAVVQKLGAIDTTEKVTVAELLEDLTTDEKQAILRLSAPQNFVTDLKN
jgi:7-cyano-7-deazaguanine synthase in queuosine biosynthesis